MAKEYHQPTGTLTNWSPPIPGQIKITSGWGRLRSYRNEGGKLPAKHQGVDIAAAIGTPVQAIGDGKVVKVHYWKPGGGTPGDRAGNYIRIQHPNGYCSEYMHLSGISVKPGDTIRGGELIGKSGATGGNRGNKGKENATPMSPHLHFQIRNQFGDKIPPMDFVKIPSVDKTISTSPAASELFAEWSDTKWLDDIIDDPDGYSDDTYGDSKFESIFGGLLNSDEEELSLDNLISSLTGDGFESDFEENMPNLDTELEDFGEWVDSDGDGASDTWMSNGFLDFNLADSDGIPEEIRLDASGNSSQETEFDLDNFLFGERENEYTGTLNGIEIDGIELELDILDEIFSGITPVNSPSENDDINDD
ncbi:MAG: M23 family metallopeptidase [Caldilineaceae bacterium]